MKREKWLIAKTISTKILLCSGKSTNACEMCSTHPTIIARKDMAARIFVSCFVISTCMFQHFVEFVGTHSKIIYILSEVPRDQRFVRPELISSLERWLYRFTHAVRFLFLRLIFFINETINATATTSSSLLSTMIKKGQL